MKIAVTGHRPNKMPGYTYELDSQKWQTLIHKFVHEIIAKYDCREAISGMALGVDQAWALAALFAKDLGYDVRLTCAIPCKNHASNWPQKSQDLYAEILDKADKIVIVTDREYEPWMMQKRNIWMLDQLGKTDMLLSVWDGSPGGTGNCVNEAIKRKLRILNIDPLTLGESSVK